ncbi:hypothetical protein CNECB9_1950022 [Cupriavidus necator]|uniref:Uncharacterized protein n=1 Tax=Cupriavidus necator TaxID=106590 RepID=A0A1K0J6H2_CUPNE|nr:hypothetical protein CNECB9_1950022 [Cupriavidus necator]
MPQDQTGQITMEQSRDVDGRITQQQGQNDHDCMPAVSEPTHGRITVPHAVTVGGPGRAHDIWRQWVDSRA